MTTDQFLNDFAFRCFRDLADGDYIVARMAAKTYLVPQFLWAGHQAIEKYLKCILLLNRIPAKKVMHDLGAAIAKIESPGNISLGLSPVTKKFVERLDELGRFRYLEVSNVCFDSDLIKLDRAVWEMRRFCTLVGKYQDIRLREGVAPPKYHLNRGYLEKIMDGERGSARKALLWQNAFFGKKTRTHVRFRDWFSATNSPLCLHPEMLDEVLAYVFLPKDIVDAYRHRAP